MIRAKFGQYSGRIRAYKKADQRTILYCATEYYIPAMKQNDEPLFDSDECWSVILVCKVLQRN